MLIKRKSCTVCAGMCKVFTRECLKVHSIRVFEICKIVIQKKMCVHIMHCVRCRRRSYTDLTCCVCLSHSPHSQMVLNRKATFFKFAFSELDKILCSKKPNTEFHKRDAINRTYCFPDCILSLCGARQECKTLHVAEVF